MISKRKQKYIALMALIPLLLSLFIAPTHAATVNESESNNTYSTADVTADDNNNYGKLSSTSDVDWWKMTFTQTGMVNFWLGGISSSYTYNMDLYESTVVGGVSRIAYTTTTAQGNPGLIRARVYPNVTYYMKISASSSVSTSNYLFRAKRYALNPGSVFTFDFIDPDQDNRVYQTRDTATLTLPRLWNMGYSAQEYLNNRASVAYEALPYTDITVISSHGEDGRVDFCKTEEDGMNYLYGNYDPAGIYSRAISGYGAEALSQLDLLVISSCKSAVYDGAWGSLINEAKNKGVFCVIGWNDLIYIAIPDGAEYSIDNLWLNQFFYQLSTGANIQDAITITNYYCDDLHETYHQTYITAIKNIGTGTSTTTALIVG